MNARVVLSIGAAVALSSTSAAGATCESLAALALPNARITMAQPVAMGAFAPSAGQAGGPSSSFRDVPAFCRVTATLTPSADSDIKIEVWLPASEWNGKFVAVGNGGWTGSISYGPMAAMLRRGYATASTDTGHAGGSGSFALDHPEKLVDFGYRAVHEMTGAAKAITSALYGTGPRLSYWNGCSSGGRQGLKEAQKFPADYDGIIAGAPANYWTHLVAQSLWVAHATLKDPASLIPRDKYPLIHKAVVEACDALDGVKDGLLEDPLRCRFDPKALQCAGEDAPTCLTPPQVAAARRIYAPATNPRDGAPIFPGMALGSELGWAPLAGGPKPLSIADDHFKYVVFKDPSWDFRTLDFDRDVARADALDNGLLNAIDPDLKTFFGHGGKLLMYHGWSDQLIAPQNSINYFTSMLGASGAKAADSARLFMVPGMAHCGGGEGPSTFDSLTALEQWVERGQAPARIIASQRDVRTRPLCPYPQVAQYTGSGSTDTAASFACKTP